MDRVAPSGRGRSGSARRPPASAALFGEGGALREDREARSSDAEGNRRAPGTGRRGGARGADLEGGARGDEADGIFGETDADGRRGVRGAAGRGTGARTGSWRSDRSWRDSERAGRTPNRTQDTGPSRSRASTGGPDQPASRTGSGRSAADSTPSRRDRGPATPRRISGRASTAREREPSPAGRGTAPPGRESGTRGTAGGDGSRRPPPGRSRVAAVEPAPRSRPARRLRIGLCVASALVFVLTGGAWGMYRNVTAGLTTTNVITGGSSGGGQNILLVGVDSRTDAQGNPLPDEVLQQLRSGAEPGVLNSDTIILLHLPADGSSATALSIPRDSYVDIPGYRQDKINAAYPATKALTAERLVAEGRTQQEADQESSAAGRSALIKTVEQLTGVGIDHYAEVNLLGFYNLTRAIGGVEVCLNAPVDDEFSGARFPAGRQTISGADALAFVRQRHGLAGGDLSRIRRQQVFLAAVADKMLGSGTLTNPASLSALIDVAQKSLVIDSGWDLLAFAKQASDLAAGNVEFVTIPTQGGASNARGDVVLVDPVQVRAFVEEQTQRRPQQSAAPAGPAGSTGPAGPAARVDPAAVTVDVGNGSGTTGLAAQIADRLAVGGFAKGTVDNAAPRGTSVVRYAAADGDAAAKAVAAQLGGIGVERAEGITPGHVSVLLGTDLGSPASASGGTPGTAAPAQTPVNAGGVPCID